MKFSKALIRKTAALIDDLEKLHELWYKVNLLERRYSGVAEDMKNNLVADFYQLSITVAQEINERFTDWLGQHTKDGWWDRVREQLIQGGGILHWGSEEKTIDIRSTLAPKLLQHYIEQNATSLIEYLLGQEGLSSHAPEYVKQYYPDETIDPEHAWDFLRDNSDILGYSDWLKEKNYFDGDYTDLIYKYGEYYLDDIYGDDWLEHVQNNISDSDWDSAKDNAWKQWLQFWPGYIKTFEQVQQALSRMNAAMSSNDINQRMSAISLCLNVAHNSGLMFEHLDLSKDQMDNLSHMDTKQWDQNVQHVANKNEI